MLQIIYMHYTVIVVRLDIYYWYQNVTHNSLSFYFRIAPCTSIHSAYTLNRFKVMLLHTLTLSPTRVEHLVCERFVSLEPYTWRGDRRAIHLFRPRGFVLLDHFWEELTYSSSLSLQQGDLSTNGILHRGRGVLLPRYIHRPSET